LAAEVAQAGLLSERLTASAHELVERLVPGEQHPQRVDLDVAGDGVRDDDRPRRAGAGESPGRERRHRNPVPIPRPGESAADPAFVDRPPTTPPAPRLGVA
jgi:hypothetical protein